MGLLYLMATLEQGMYTRAEWQQQCVIVSGYCCHVIVQVLGAAESFASGSSAGGVSALTVSNATGKGVLGLSRSESSGEATSAGTATAVGKSTSESVLGCVAVREVRPCGCIPGCARPFRHGPVARSRHGWT